MVPFTVTLSDPLRRFQGHGDALDELYAELTRDLFAIAKFLLNVPVGFSHIWHSTKFWDPYVFMQPL